ncbi:MAG: hypothetical protein LBB67_00355 [Oscillospiraceae bacterium]|nr:hypothetical protein [Oscillospiraceae bacterium]
MREDYVPNEKYRNMFGVERNGYGMERVDLYLAQLEVAFKKIREDNRGLKRELTEQTARAQSAAGLMPPVQMPEIAQPIPGQTELLARLQQQLQEQRQQNTALLAKLAEQDDLRSRMQSHTDGLLQQIAALRSETDDLRQRTRIQQQPAAQMPVMHESAFDDGKEQLIGKVLIEARATAEQTVRDARMEAEQILQGARTRVEELRSEQERIQSQLQSVAYALRHVLRDGADTNIRRGDEFAVS